MDRFLNPYSPGAGSPPPDLAGRRLIREDASIAFRRLRANRHIKNILLVGLRGVGKTVLLDALRADAEAEGILTVRADAQEKKSLPSLLAPQLRLALIELSRVEAAKDQAAHTLRVLASFVKGFKMKYGDVELAFDAKPLAGEADSGDLELDLAYLLQRLGETAKDADTAVVLFIDELQYVPLDQFAAMIAALHRCSQRQLPVALVGAGLPRLRENAGNAKSYAERMFEFPQVDRLRPEDAMEAIQRPALDAGVAYEQDALDSILRLTQGYPYFLQEWGKHTWDTARQSPITASDVETASAATLAALDANFFLVRFDRVSPSERRYLRAMAELGPGPHRSGDIAAVLGKKVSTFGPVRERLIAVKGMIWSPSHGDTAFTVPLFDEFMKRIMPGDEWKNE